MRNIKLKLLIFGGLIILNLNILGCITTPYVHPQSEKWDALIASPQYQAEKKIFEQRTGGIKYCGDTGVSSFIQNPSLKPEKMCIYPATPYVIENKDNPYRKNIPKQALKQLKVIQVTPNGLLIDTPQRSYSTNAVFIHKTDEIGLVDGSYLDETNWIMYEYMGPYTYESLSGANRTVHSFKKLIQNRFEKEFKGIKMYGPLKDYLIKNQLYEWIPEK